MTTPLDTVIGDLRRSFGDAVLDAAEFRGETTVTVAAAAVPAVAAFLRDNPACPFPLLEELYGIDAYTRAPRFEVNYQLFSLRERLRLRLKTFAAGPDPAVPTVTGVFPAAGWPEREAFDMYGIVFTGHPDLRRIYMPEEFAHFPLRKDFPLMGIPDSLPLPRR
jgi:NADH-quinone oxidoreductase subunit C